MAHCDGCNKDRRSVTSCGQDDNGVPDAPDLCFLCLKEGARGKVFDPTTGKYVKEGPLRAQHEDALRATEPRPPQGEEDAIPF